MILRWTQTRIYFPRFFFVFFSAPESACCAKLGCEETKNTSEVACNPSSIQQNELRKRLPSGEIRSFLYMKWEPCLAAIDNLDGYLVSIIKIIFFIGYYKGYNNEMRNLPLR